MHIYWNMPQFDLLTAKIVLDLVILWIISMKAWYNRFLIVKETFGEQIPQ